jgi:hypothetical protein
MINSGSQGCLQGSEVKGSTDLTPFGQFDPKRIASN